VDDPVELALLDAWWREAARVDPTVAVQQTPTRGRTPAWVQRALYALSGSAYFAGLGERALVGALKQVRAYLTDDGTRARVQQRVRAAISSQTSVVVGHSLGSVAGYEVLCATPGLPVRAFVTLGSPLGIPNLVFDRLTPTPVNGKGAWPGAVREWTNVADEGDVVALTKALAPRFSGPVVDVLVHNGAKAHDVRPYLTARETGLALLAGLRQ
jgi:pimeloyl-ACP methyl ester carboxylesterase